MNGVSEGIIIKAHSSGGMVQMFQGRMFLYLVLLCTAFTSAGQSFDVMLAECADFQSQPYSVLPYIYAAIELQSMGRDSATAVLRDCCRIEGNDSRVIVLCRMLFARDSGMRRPLIGGAVFPGGTDYSHWPEEPIEIVEGVPFLIVQGYMLGGVPESAAAYLEYCESDCVWRDEQYRVPDESELRESMEAFLNSDKWQTPLSVDEIQFFTSQIAIDR